MDKLTWLSTSLLQKILQDFEKNESIQVSSVDVKPATAIGENFSSDLHRVSVKVSRIPNGNEITESKSVIVKVGPLDVRKSVGAGFFETEISMLQDTLPRINEILAESSMASLSGRCLHVEYETPFRLYIEDLVAAGYRIADRRAGLDLDHCLLAIRNLAIFHAGSVALGEKDPNALRKYERGLYHKDRTAAFSASGNASVRILGEEAANWTELNPRISEKILKISESAYEKACEAVQLREDDFNVLNHGDFTVINIMFRYNEQGKPIDMEFVDFQLCVYGSPAVDISYFLGTSSSVDVRVNHRQLLLREYHESLISTMAKLKCNTEAPSCESFQEILNSRAFCEVIPSFVILPMLLCDKSLIGCITATSTASEKYQAKQRIFRGELYRKIMLKILPFYDSMGLLDV